MANMELLSSKKHKDLFVELDKMYDGEHSVSSTMVFRNELEQVQRSYPIFFRKDSETGHFYPSVLLGFTEKENLFVNKGVWLSDYIPLAIEKGPFVIGFQDQKTNESVEKKPVIYIDMDHSCLSRESGERLFHDDVKSLYLKRISGILMSIHEGIESTKSMIQAFTSINLIESVNIDIKLDSGEELHMGGLYTINEETLTALDAETLSKLNGSGYLKNAFSIIHSLQNVNYLVQRKNNT